MIPEASQPLAHALFPDLAARARLAAPGADPVERWVAEQTERMRAGAFGAALARYPAGADHEALAAAFAAAAWIATRCGIRCPDPEELFAVGARAVPGGGVQGGAEGEGEAEGGAAVLPPALRPVPAPHGLGAAAWLRCFGGAAAGTAGLGVPEVPRSRESESGGPLPVLALSSEVTRWFAALDQPGDPAAPRLSLPERVGPVTWTLRWIPASVHPPRTGRPLRAADAVRSPTLPELLTLQVMRARRGQPPVDARSFTWLAGELPDARFAARHGYDASTHTIRVGTRERTDQGPHVGTRHAR